MTTRDPAARLSPPVDPSRDHVSGPLDAPVTLVEYGDYECPHCRRAHRGVARVRDELAAGKVRVAWRHFPNRRAHPHAELAAQAAEAAAAQGRFWEMHARLLAEESTLDRSGLIAAAEAIGLDVERFARELDSGMYASRVEDDVRSAERSGAHATPTFYVDGRRYDGPWDMEALLEAVRKPLGWRLRLLAEQFAGLSTSSGLLMLTGVVVALVWANSPWRESYLGFWEAPLDIGLGAWSLDMSLHAWVNDALIVLFFLVVALEIRSEVTDGELASISRAALPFAAAAGGMLLPALFYWGFNAGTPTAHGWGVPIGTDTAFALGLLAILGSRVPISLRVFVAAAAIADDVVAIVIIAVFYTEDLSLPSLGIALLLWLLALALARGRIYRSLPYVVIGVLLWLAVLDAGVHPTLAGVLLAFALPTRGEPAAEALLAQSQSLLQSLEKPPVGDVTPARQEVATRSLESMVDRLLSPAQRVARDLEPWSAYFVLPVFAFANAGVELDLALSDFLQPVALGIGVGLFFGKPLGIAGGAWIAAKTGLATKPADVSWWHMVGAGTLCGIGFTMSFFIAGLAFSDEETLALAKVSVLATSVVAGLAGWAILYVWNEHRRRKIRRRAEVTDMQRAA